MQFHHRNENDDGRDSQNRGNDQIRNNTPLCIFLTACNDLQNLEPNLSHRNSKNCVIVWIPGD